MSSASMPKATVVSRTVTRVGKKNPDDEAVEERIRAHVRQRMEYLNLGVTKAAELCEVGQGSLSKILLRQRGMGLGMAVRLITHLGLDALRTLTLDPDERFFRSYVPKPKDEP